MTEEELQNLDDAKIVEEAFDEENTLLLEMVDSTEVLNSAEAVNTEQPTNNLNSASLDYDRCDDLWACNHWRYHCNTVVGTNLATPMLTVAYAATEDDRYSEHCCIHNGEWNREASLSRAT